MAYVDDKFYPVATTPDQTIGAGTVRAMLNTLPSINSATQCTWAGATITDITVIPLANNATTGTDTTANNGWAFNNGDAVGLGSTATAKRVVPTGTWVFTGTVNLNIPAALQTVSATIKAVVYRVATGGGARTELFRTAASVAMTNSSATATLDVNYSVSITSVAAITLQAGEVLMIGYIITSRSTQNALNQVTNTVVKFYLGNQSALTAVTVPTPGIRTLYLNTFSAIVAVIASIIKQAHKPFSALSTGVAAFTRRITGFRTLTAVATVVTGFSRAVTAARSFVNVASVTAIFDRRLSAVRTLTAVVSVIPILSKRAFKSFSAVAMIVPAFSRLITAFRSFTNVALVVPAFTKAATLRRTLTATVTVVATLAKQVGKPLSAIAVGTATKVVRVGKAFTNVATVVPTFAKVIQKGTFVITANVTTGFARAVTAARSFTAQANVAAKMFVQISDTILSRMVSGGGTTIIKKITYLFDD